MELDSDLLKLEERRKEIEKKSRTANIFAGLFFSLTILFLIISIVFMTQGKNIIVYVIIFLISLMCGIGTLIIGSNGKSELEKELKTNLRSEYSRKFYKEYIYNYKGKLDELYFKKSNLFPRYNIYDGSGYSNGVYNNIEFETSDYILKQRNVYYDKNGYHETIVIVDTGRLFVFQLKKTFDCTLYIMEKKFLTSSPGGKKIEMESIEFNKKFAVYCDDAEMAYYIINPRFMDKLFAFEKMFKGDISIKIQGNTVLIVISKYAPFFKFDIHRSFNDENYLNDFIQDVGSAKIIIDDLDFDEAKFNYQLKEK